MKKQKKYRYSENEVSKQKRMLLSNAAMILRENHARRKSRKFLAKDGERKIVYLFDTSIIKAYAAPWDQSPGMDVFPGQFTRILDENDSPKDDTEKFEQKWMAEHYTKATLESREKLTQIILEHIIQLNKAQDLPIMQLSAHFEETNGSVYRGVRRDLDKQRRDTSSSGTQLRDDWILRNEIITLRARARADGEQNIKNNKDQFFAIKRVMDRIQSQNHQNKLEAEWDRYVGLDLNYHGITQMADSKFIVDSFGEGVKNIPTTKGRIEKIREKLEDASDWDRERLADFFKSRLQKHKNRRRGTEQVSTDAEALALLYQLNHFSRKNGNKVRFIFVTDDRSLVQSCYANDSTPSNSDHTPKDFKKFSERYVRHVWAFLVDALRAHIPEIENETNNRSPDPKNFFEGLFANWQGFRRSSNLDLELLENFAQEVGNSGLEGATKNLIYEDFSIAEATWQGMIDIATKSQNLMHRGSSPIFKKQFESWAKSIILDEKLGWTEALDLSQEYFARAKDLNDTELSEAGVSFIGEHLGSQDRSPPEVTFENLTNSQDIIDALTRPSMLSEGGQKIDYNAQQFRNDFERISDECHDYSLDGDNRQLVHLRYVVLGALYASREKWSLALDQCQRALDVIDRGRGRSWSMIEVKRNEDGKPITNMSGREAAFLASIAARLLARDSDLNKYEEEKSGYLALSEDYLNRARVAHKKDIDAGTAVAEMKLKFEVETLSWSLARYYLLRKRNESQFYDDDYTNLEQQSKEVFHLLSDGMTHPSSTLVAASLNVIQVVVVSEFRKLKKRAIGISEDDKEAMLRRALTEIYNNTDICLSIGKIQSESKEPNKFACKCVEASVVSSKLTTMYSIAGAMILGEKNFWAPNNLENIKVIFRDFSLSAADYDKWRVEKLKLFIFNYLSETPASFRLAKEISELNIDEYLKKVSVV